MAAEKLVDGEFLGNLMKGSLESRVGAAMEAVANHGELFGVTDNVDARVIATYASQRSSVFSPPSIAVTTELKNLVDPNTRTASILSPFTW